MRHWDHCAGGGLRSTHRKTGMADSGVGGGTVLASLFPPSSVIFSHWSHSWEVCMGQRDRRRGIRQVHIVEPVIWQVSSGRHRLGGA